MYNRHFKEKIIFVDKSDTGINVLFDKGKLVYFDSQLKRVKSKKDIHKLLPSLVRIGYDYYRLIGFMISVFN
jgi:hypothetical protein